MAAAAEAAADYMNEGKICVVQIDIHKYFDNIPFSFLETQINSLKIDASIKRLMKKYLHLKIDVDGKLYDKKLGIIQGSPLSPFLANLYLTPFDNFLSGRGLSFCRFGDDIAIFLSDMESANQIFQEAVELLKEQYCLEINAEKSGVFEGIKQKYIGYTFQKDKKTGQIIAIKKQKEPKEFYGNWSVESIQKVDHNYHLINDGILSRRDYNILFENESGKKYIPVETTTSLNVYSNIIFSAEFFRFVSMHRICVNIFDKYGECIGTFVPEDSGFKGKTLLKQTSFYMNEKARVASARKIEIASLHNIRANMRYYLKKSSSEILQSAINEISKCITEMNQAEDINEMMMIEARARLKYYMMFNEIIKDQGFLFEKRTRMPPKDPINTLISFGNTYLYNRIATEIEKTSLDLRIGIVHSTNTRSRTLNLDVADIFKPIIVDRAIFTIINKRMISATEHFEKVENGGIYLNKAGKRIFINALEDKIYSKVTVNGKNISYDTIIKQEISKLFRMFVKDEVYKPYKY